MLAIHKHVTSTDDASRKSSALTDDESFADKNASDPVVSKSPILAEKAATTLEMVGLESAGSFMRIDQCGAWKIFRREQ